MLLGTCAGQIRVDVAGRRRGRTTMIGIIGSGDAKTVEAFLTKGGIKLIMLVCLIAYGSQTVPSDHDKPE